MKGLLSLLCLIPIVSAGQSWFEIPNAQLLPKAQDAQAVIDLPFDLIFLDKKIPKDTKVWISSNGYFTIGKDFKKFRKVMFPLPDASEDPMAVVAFKARMQYRPDEGSDREASVSYSKELPESILSELNAIISTNVASAKGFKSKHALAVSWDKVSFFGGNPMHSPYPRNTFQVVVTTDGVSTFAIFNYKKIVWDGGMASGGNANTGVGAHLPYAQAGISAGNGEGFHKLDYGSNILDIDKEQASGNVGQYVYKLSSRVPRPHGCVTKRPDSMPVHLSPSSGPMFGGNPVEVSDACFSRHSNIECHFGDQVVTGKYLQHSKAVCYAPTFYGNEQYKFKLFVDGKEVYTKETFYLASIQQPNMIQLVNLDKWRSLKPNGNLKMTWNPEDLSQYTGRLSVKLYVYQESGRYYGWNEEEVIEEGVSNTGTYTFDPSKVTCKKNCKEKTVGAVVLEMVDSFPGRLWSNVGPLGWFVDKDLKRTTANNWPAQMCYDWFVKDGKQGLNWLNELEDCPCTKDQAVGDIGRFIADPGCNMYNKDSSNNCYYHQKAQHCVRSIWPSYPTGAGVQCCYDAQGSLMYAGDSIYGSTVDKGHSLGAAPYNAPGYIPSLSHWLYDVITYQYCCLWSSVNFTCGLYMDQRPTKDCKYYKSAKTAAVYGESHLHTFDGKKYRQDKPGTYTLIKSNPDTGNINIQAVFTKVPSTAAPLVTGIAMKSDKSSLVEITLNSPNSRKKRTTIKVDGVEKDFLDPKWSKQQYRGVQIWTGGMSAKVNHSNFTISLVHGIGLLITATRHNINVIVTLPSSSLTKSLRRETLLSGSTNSRIAEVGAHDSLFQTSTVTYTAVDDDITSPAKEVSQYSADLQALNQPVISCDMPVRHGIRRGTSYTAGAETEVISCRVGYQLQSSSSNRRYTCNSSGTWVPTLNDKCNYVGFPLFDPPSTTRQSITTPATSPPTTTKRTQLPTTTRPTTTTPTTTTSTSTTPPTTTTPVKATAKSSIVPNTTTTTTATTEAISTTPFIDIFYNETENATGNASLFGALEVSTWLLPVLVENHAALPLTLTFSVLFIVALLFIAFRYRHRYKFVEDGDSFRPSDQQRDDTDDKGEYLMSSTGSVEVAPSATADYQNDQETLEIDRTSGMKSYRVAVDYPPDNYSAHTSSSVDEEEAVSGDGTEHGSDKEEEDPASRLKSYRVAVDPLPTKRSYTPKPYVGTRYQPSKNRLSPAMAFDENEEDQATRLASYRVAVDPPPEPHRYQSKTGHQSWRKSSGRSKQNPDIVVEEVEL